MAVRVDELVQEGLKPPQGLVPDSPELAVDRNRRENGVAFVLSGGSNRGALQVGAMQALLEHGIKPTMFIGTSVGAMNAAMAATDPSLEGINKLAEIWQGGIKTHLFPGRLSMLWRLITRKDSLVASEKLKHLIEANLPQNIRCFDDLLDTELYIVATNLNTARMHIFGQDPSESIVDAIMASTALPPYFPPWSYREQQYVDGGAVANLPVRVAVELGARDIYAIDLGCTVEPTASIKGLFNIARRTIRAMTQQLFLNDLKWLAANSWNTIYHIAIPDFSDLPIWDLNHTAEMIEQGKRTAEEFLNRRVEEPSQQPAEQPPYQSPLIIAA